MAERKKTKSKSKRKVSSGVAHILSSFNNTIISIGDENGNILAWSSSGLKGFKGSRKSTPFAATEAAKKAAADAMAMGLSTIEVRVIGPGGGREAAIRALRTSGLIVTKIMDITPIPHNGCRPPKKRRV